MAGVGGGGGGGPGPESIYIYIYIYAYQSIQCICACICTKTSGCVYTCMQFYAHVRVRQYTGTHTYRLTYMRV